MRSRRGVMGDVVEMIPVLILICAIAFVVFGMSSTLYSYDISVRDAEARLLARGVVDCLAGEGVLDLDSALASEGVLDYCGFRESERFYVGVQILDFGGGKVGFLEEGDSGLLWVRDLFEKAGSADIENERVKKIINYAPGYFSGGYLVRVLDSGSYVDGRVELEVLVNHEE